MTHVVDASVVVAALVDSGRDGIWAESIVAEGGLHAPAIMPFEVANILRRAERAREITAETAALAHRDLADLRVRLVPYAGLADRTWELRQQVAAYDASYVALAELLDIPLATLDGRLTRAHGVRCRFTRPR